jgi:hypothetical protein
MRAGALRRDHVIAALEASPGVTMRALMKFYSVSRSSAKAHLYRLLAAGVVTRVRGGWKLFDPATDSVVERDDPDTTFDDWLADLMHEHPNAPARVFAALLAVGTTRVESGFRRLADRGIAVKRGKRWVCAAQEPEIDVDEIEDEEVGPDYGDEGKFVRHINRFVRAGDSMFSCVRFG